MPRSPLPESSFLQTLIKRRNRWEVSVLRGSFSPQRSRVRRVRGAIDPLAALRGFIVEGNSGVLPDFGAERTGRIGTSGVSRIHGIFIVVDRSGAFPAVSRRSARRKLWWLTQVISVAGVTTAVISSYHAYRTQQRVEQERVAVRLLHVNEFQQFEEALADMDLDQQFRVRPINRAARTLLQRGRDFFEEFAELYSDDPHSDLMYAKAIRLSAQINEQLGAVGEAKLAYQQALALPSPDPEDFELCANRVDTHLRLTLLLARTHGVGAARISADRTLRAALEFENHFPGDLTSCQLLSASLRNSAFLHWTDGNRVIAAAQLEQAVAVSRQLAAEYPDEVSVYEVLADTLQLAARVARMSDDVSRARELCGESEAVLQRLMDERHFDVDSDHALRPSSRYRTALAAVKNNRISLDGSDDGTTTPWQWQDLSLWPTALTWDLVVATRLPGEFEPQDAILLAWPDAEWCHPAIAQIAAHASTTTDVVLMVESQHSKDLAQASISGLPMADLSRLRFVTVPIAKPWVRDFGPVSVVGPTGQSYWFDGQFDNEFTQDSFLEDQTPVALSRSLNRTTSELPMYYEGGAVLTNGSGITILSRALLDCNLYLGYTRDQIIHTLKRVTGAQQVVVVDPLIDETTGHVDWFLTFVNADTVVVGQYADDSANAKLLDETAQRLAEITTSRGKLKVERIPMPPRADEFFGGTYTNVVYANGLLIVPSWSGVDPQIEQAALDVYRRLLPKHRLVTIHCDALGLRGGALHCAALNLHRAP